MQRVTGLVYRVITSHPSVVLVPQGDLFPQPYGAVLEILVVPKRGVVGKVVAVPVGILSSRDGVQVQNSVDTVFSALKTMISKSLPSTIGKDRSNL